MANRVNIALTNDVVDLARKQNFIPALARGFMIGGMSKKRKTPARPNHQRKIEGERKTRRRADSTDRRERIMTVGCDAAGSFFYAVSRDSLRVRDTFTNWTGAPRRRLKPTVGLGKRLLAGQDCDPLRAKFVARKMERREAALLAQKARRLGLPNISKQQFLRRICKDNPYTEE